MSNPEQTTTSGPGATLAGLLAAMQGQVFTILLPIGFMIVCAVVIVPLKWALGIYNIERYLAELQRNLSASEDTIFSYRYDYRAPLFMEQKALAETYGEEIVRSILVANTPSTLPADDLKALRRVKPKIINSGRTTFQFSSAAGAKVYVDFDIACYDFAENLINDRSGIFQQLRPTVKVNATELSITATPQGWEGSMLLTLDHLRSSEPIGQIDENDWLQRHHLSLDMFGRAESEVIWHILTGELDSCVFNSMVFVRDVPGDFKGASALTWIRGRLP